MPENKDILVVPELPQSPVRTIEGDDGKTYELITVSEAIKEILESTRRIEEGLFGKK